MPVWTDVSYVYDGTLEGLLCCAFESFQKKENPAEIRTEQTEQLSLYRNRQIITDPERARRVHKGIVRIAFDQAYELIELGFLTCHPQKERLILDFMRLAMQRGKQALSMLTDPTVSALQQAVSALQRESHKFIGFVRFSEYDGILLSFIEPKNRVLSLMATHFADRFPNEQLMICDTSHQEALLARAGEYSIVPLQAFDIPREEAREQQYRVLWKTFYDAIAIEHRGNPQCRMNMMPKRYWKNLTEMNQTADACLKQRLEQEAILAPQRIEAP